MAKRALDVATQDYHKRKGRLELPGFVIIFISLPTLLAGIYYGYKPIIVIALLFLSLGIGMMIIAKAAHKSLFRK